jgi:hypothetical protein
MFVMFAMQNDYSIWPVLLKMCNVSLYWNLYLYIWSLFLVFDVLVSSGSKQQDSQRHLYV